MFMNPHINHRMGLIYLSDVQPKDTGLGKVKRWVKIITYLIVKSAVCEIMTVPEKINIYHIVHVDRLPTIIEAGGLWCDTKVVEQELPGTSIGISEIKERRRTKPLESHKQLHVGDCVPFYFCPRSIMLYILHKANHENLSYRGGQDKIVHLEADFYEVVDWAEQQKKRWAFTLSNAGSHYFEDRCHESQLDEINWAAVNSRSWSNDKGQTSRVFSGGIFPLGVN